MSGFTCPLCGATTTHPPDVAERYCPRCHQFPELLRSASEAVDRGDLSDGELERLAAGTGFTVPAIQRAFGKDDGHPA